MRRAHAGEGGFCLTMWRRLQPANVPCLVKKSPAPPIAYRIMTQPDLDLLADFVGDRITAEAFPRLEALLQSSAPARRALRGLTLVEQTLSEIAVERYFNVRGAETRPTAPPAAKPSEAGNRPGWASSPVMRRLAMYVAAPLAVAALAAVVLVVEHWQRQAALRPAIPAGAIAQIVALSDVAWQPDAQVHHEADGLQNGSTLALTWRAEAPAHSRAVGSLPRSKTRPARLRSTRPRP
jgi:hypothetical protein